MKSIIRSVVLALSISSAILPSCVTFNVNCSDVGGVGSCFVASILGTRNWVYGSNTYNSCSTGCSPTTQMEEFNVTVYYTGCDDLPHEMHFHTCCNVL